jgi:hypothetical protein
MAEKMVFHPGEKSGYAEEIISFHYVQGLAFSQKQKNVDSLHHFIQLVHPGARILEVSTKSREKIGVAASAFNLRVGGSVLESVFQSAKVFAGVGAFPEVAKMGAKEARDYVKEKSAGHPLVGFSYAGNDFPLEPKSFFYDWLYVNALVQSSLNLADYLAYDTFTDIEFNEKKQVNCQARSLAIMVSLKRKGLLEEALTSPTEFRRLVYQE